MGLMLDKSARALQSAKHKKLNIFKIAQVKLPISLKKLPKKHWRSDFLADVYQDTPHPLFNNLNC